MDQEGIYVYCLARAGAVPSLDVEPVEGPTVVVTIEQGQLAAVVNHVNVAELQKKADGDPPDTAWIFRAAMRHEQVIEAAMKHSPVVPLRFGTLFSGEATLLAFLRKYQHSFLNTLYTFADREEWAVKCFIDRAVAFEYLCRTESDLITLQQQMSASPGTRYFQEKKYRSAVQQNIASVIELVRSGLTNDLQFELLPRAVPEIVELRLQGRDSSPPGLEMIGHWAVLLRKGLRHFLEKELKEYETRFAKVGVSVLITGPWPPFNFCPSLDDAEPTT